MNAAFLLVSSAWLAGGQAPPPAAPPAAQVAPSAYGSCGSCGSCGSTCGCNECEKPGLLDRLKARFHREKDCGCEAAPACHSCAPAPVYHPAPSCGSCGSTCDSCDKPGLLDRLKARFHREKECGCESCGAPACSSCGAAPLPAKPGEPIKPPTDGPMKLPSGDKPGDKPTDKPKETSSPKNLELTPTGGARIIESGTRNPY